MARQSDWPRTITIIYTSIYSTAIFITGVWSAWQVWQRPHEEESDTQKRNKQADTKKEEEKEDELVVADERTDNESGDRNKLQLDTAKEAQDGGGAGFSPDENEEKEDELLVDDHRTDNKLHLSTSKEPLETGTSAVPSKCKLFASFVKLWWELFKGKSEMYLLLVPHIFDQATDAGAISEFFAATVAYGELTEEEKENTFDPTWFFRFSVFIFVFQRVVSSGMVYFMTNRNLKASLLQIFDVLILRAIWVNYDLGLTEPCNPQLYIELLEATFESAPQLLLSAGYLLRQSTSSAQTGISTFIVIQVVFSLYSLSAKISSDDKAVFAEEYQNLVVKNDDSCWMKRSLNYKWFLRVVFWRFLEISSRFCILLLIWFGVGGLPLCVVIVGEICLFFLCACGQERVDLLVNVLYLMIDSLEETEFDLMDGMRMCLYRIVSNVTLLATASIFVAVRFEAAQVPEFSDRHDLFVRSNVGLAILIYAWISQFIWPYFVFYFVRDKKIEKNKIATRSTSECVGAGRPEEALQLLRFGVLMDAKETLHTAAQYGQTVVKYLVEECNADCNEQDRFGKTPLHWAAQQGQTGIVKYLAEERNVDCNQADGKGQTPLHWAAGRKRTEVVQYLVEERNANCNQADGDGQTPLHLAAQNSRTEIVKCMVEKGNADSKKTDKYGQTPLLWAAREGQTEVVQYLVEDGNADCNQANTFGETPLHWAARRGQTGVVQYLVEKGNADCNQADIKDDRGQTPLHWAAETGQTEVVQYLVEKGNADCNQTDKNGKTALQLAKQKHAEYVVNENDKTALQLEKQKHTEYVVRYLQSK